MTALHELASFLESFAPLSLAEDWDNVGLLVGQADDQVQRVMTCLTVTPATVAEAVQRQADLIVTHHPLPFKSLKRITDQTTPGRMLLQLIRNRIALYSPHTAFDSTVEGINQRLAEAMLLQEIQPLEIKDPDTPEVGAGRHGSLSETQSLAQVAEHLKSFLCISSIGLVGNPEQTVSRIAVACGSAGEFLPRAIQVGCDVLVTGETTFHTCLEAEAHDVGVLLPGHFASERFALECLAEVLAEAFPQLEVWAAEKEVDPVNRL